MRVLVFGMGAIGSVFAARLSKRHEVVGVCRGEHYEEIKRSGLKLRGGTEGTFSIRVYRSLKELDEKTFDLVLIATKSYDLKQALKAIKRDITFSYLMTVQNGLGLIDILEEVIGRSRVIYGITYNAAVLVRPGVVDHVFLGETVIKSLVDDPFDEYLVKELKSVGLPARKSDNILKDIWLKGTVNCVINPLTAILREKNGIIREKWDLLSDVVSGVVTECLEAAKIDGVDLGSPQELLDLIKDVSLRTSENRSSMLQDILKGRRTEIEFLNCYVASRLESMGKRAPYNRALCALIRSMEGLS